MSTFINFRELRSQLDFRSLLASYGVAIANDGKEKYQGPCPLPTHQGASRKAPFSADCVRGIWQCFSCGASGNLLDFAVRMEHLDPLNGSDVRKVALLLRKRFTEAHHAPHGAAEPAPQAVKASERVVINPPLSFALKGLDQEHPSVRALGLSSTTITHFGLGYCSRGSLEGRIAIPLHDTEGTLVGYVGRSVSSRNTSGNESLYRFPSDRERNGVNHRFDAGALLYGAHSIVDRPAQKLIVAEEISLVWHLFEFGVCAVALLTPHLTANHEAILQRIAEPTGVIFVGRSTMQKATS